MIATISQDSPLSLAVSGANRHDSVMLEPLLKERMTLGREVGTVERNLCLDAGYVGGDTVLLVKR